MHADLGRHITDDGNFVADFGDRRKVFRQLVITFSRNRLARTFVVAGLRVKGVDVRHTALQLQEDDALGLTEAWEAGIGRRDGTGLLSGFRDSREERQYAQAE